MNNGILLVEGESDQRFYTRLCQKLDLKAKVTVAPPRQVGGCYDTKGGVFNLLPTLLKQMQDGVIKRLAVSVDADHITAHGMGCQKTLETFASIVAEFGYSRIPAHERLNGFVFRHDDGLANIGLWVMPDNQADGMLEDWVKLVVRSEERPLLERITEICDEMRDLTKFKPIHRSKAEVSMWLACQDPPGHELGACIGRGLFNLDHTSVRAMLCWMKAVFP